MSDLLSNLLSDLLSYLLFDLAKKERHQKVILGDDVRYAVRGAGATSFQLKSWKTLKMKDVLHVPGLTSNLVAVSTLEDEGYDVIFSRGRVSIQKHGSIERIEIGICDGGLYRLTTQQSFSKLCYMILSV